mmetsp:Transcript_2359/g.4273  ORF Transcript_2359/g.4273 Transcript_2359/m.4273 type:complete len:110 (-) Transcript_2359:148-477(-)
MQCHPSGSWARKWLGGLCCGAPLLFPLKAPAEALQALLRMFWGQETTSQKEDVSRFLMNHALPHWSATYAQRFLTNNALSLVGVPPGSRADLPGKASSSTGTVTNVGMM